MNNDVVAFAQVMLVIIGSVFSLTVIGVMARYMWRFGSGKLQSETAPARHDEARMQRLETAVDAIAIEVERISESQRFMVGLLSESLPARRAERAELGRVITPH
jgi:Na+/phosphate symporter